MCGRYRLSRRKQEIEDYFETEAEVEWEPRYNIAPTQQVGIIRQCSDNRAFSLARWGLIPHWAKDSSGHNTFNTRAETVRDKPSFAGAFQQRRCLIPADGFYEWTLVGKGKQAFHFGMRDDALFAFAGLWDAWIDPGGTKIESCSILTIAANSIMDGVHHRMPVIIGRTGHALWLDPTLRNTAPLAELLTAFEPAGMRRYPVSPRVNNVSNDDAGCAAPWTPAQATLALLF